MGFRAPATAMLGVIGVAVALPPLMAAGRGLTRPAASPQPAPSATTSARAAPATSAPAVAPASAPTRTTGTDPETGGTLRVAISEPGSIDPAFVADRQGLVVVDALFDSLTEHDPREGIVPAAASGWEVSDDGTVITFSLREQASFHDGTPVTAHDFVRSFTRVVAGTPRKSAANAHLLRAVAGFESTRDNGTPLAGVRALDDMTLEVRLREAQAEFPAVASHPALGPVPAAADTAPEEFAARPVGNGPFLMAGAWEHGPSLRLARHDGFSGDGPLLDAVDFQIYAGPEADRQAYSDFVNDGLDLAPVPPDGLAHAVDTFGRGEGGDTSPGVLDRATARISFLGFMTGRPPLDDPEVRRALSLLVDRQAVAGLSPPGTAGPATALIPPGIRGHDPDACGYCTFDPAGARTLLSGRDVGGLRLLTDQGAVSEATAARIAADVGAATGISVEVVAVPLADLVDEIQRGAADMFLFSWEAASPTPDDVLARLFASSQVDAGNLTGYRSRYVDDLLDRARRTPDGDARLALYRRAHERILDDMAATPLTHPRVPHVASARVGDLVLAPTGRADLAKVSLQR